MIKFNKSQIEKYNKNSICGTGFLAFRDIAKLCDLYSVNTGHVLDLGCGTGRSTEFLSNFCSDVVGVDISNDAIEKAKENLIKNRFYINDINTKLYNESPYDAIFSILMIFHFSSKQEIKIELEKINRSLKENGYFILIGGTKNLYTKKYETIRNVGKVPINSGDIAKIELKKINCVVKDIYWNEFDIIDIAKDAGLTILGLNYPIAKKEDNQKYQDEYLFPPYYNLIFRKLI
jgi:SAM-dependent methyltransferase